MKRGLSVLLTLALTASMMAGCGSNTGSSGAGTSGGTASAEGGGAAAFKIGSIGPTTGGAAIYGKAVMNAAQIAVDEINAAGGRGWIPDRVQV